MTSKIISIIYCCYDVYWMKNKDVIFLCGDYPENHITPEIGNDPNYIFLNDPNYEQVRLFD